MSHYAKVRDGKVLLVLVAEQDFVNTYDDGVPGEWIQTSYNTRGGVHYEPNSNTPSDDQTKAIRKNMAGVGFTYDANADAFYSPKPYDSWILNTTSYLWEAPVSYPDDENAHVWNESTTSWDAVE